MAFFFSFVIQFFTQEYGLFSGVLSAGAHFLTIFYQCLPAMLTYDEYRVTNKASLSYVRRVYIHAHA